MSASAELSSVTLAHGSPSQEGYPSPAAKPSYDQFGIPRPSTIIRFLIIPLAVLWTFFLADKNKKKTLLFGGLYGLALAVYFLLHIRQGTQIYKSLYLTPNFFFQLSKEITYFLTLVIPYGMIYAVVHLRLTEKIVKGVTVALSCLTALPIFIGDLFGSRIKHVIPALDKKRCNVSSILISIKKSPSPLKRAGEGGEFEGLSLIHI